MLLVTVQIRERIIVTSHIHVEVEVEVKVEVAAQHVAGEDVVAVTLIKHFKNQYQSNQVRLHMLLL